MSSLISSFFLKIERIILDFKFQCNEFNLLFLFEYSNKCNMQKNSQKSLQFDSKFQPQKG